MVKRLSRILDMDESAVQLCAELPFFGSVVKRLSHILHMDGSTVQLCPELPILTRFFLHGTKADTSAKIPSRCQLYKFTLAFKTFVYTLQCRLMDSYKQKNSLHTKMKAVLIFLLRL